MAAKVGRREIISSSSSSSRSSSSSSSRGAWGRALAGVEEGAAGSAIVPPLFSVDRGPPFPCAGSGCRGSTRAGAPGAGAGRSWRQTLDVPCRPAEPAVQPSVRRTRR
eukprot:scaffold4182_cov384-Prasinococcus_capsulatus_cf.AAC.9